MSYLAKTLWFIEAHHARNLSLAEIAHAGGASPYHLTRAFARCTGQSVMRYVRARRLSIAAQALAHGAHDILAVALEAGYGSHEAFTRAFCAQFSTTPETVRARGDTSELALTTAIRFDKTLDVALETPRFMQAPAMQLAGLRQRYHRRSCAGIPALWQRFLSDAIEWPVRYGVCSHYDGAGHFDYLCAVELADARALPAGWVRLALSPQRYAVFLHRGHISTIRATWHTIWNDWLPQSGLQVADAPDFERYDQYFDPASGAGEVQIWLPVKA